MYMTYERFEELYNQYMEKLDSNADIIRAYIDGKNIDEQCKVFAPFCNRDEELISIKDYMVDLYVPCKHNLELETTRIKIHKHFARIEDIFTGETMLISISPKDIKKTYTILNNVFNNTLLDIKTIKFKDDARTDYVDNCNFYTSKIYSTLNIPRYSRDAFGNVPKEISAGILVQIMQLDKAISKYTKEIILNGKFKSGNSNYIFDDYANGLHKPPNPRAQPMKYDKRFIGK